MSNTLYFFVKDRFILGVLLYCTPFMLLHVYWAENVRIWRAFDKKNFFSNIILECML